MRLSSIEFKNYRCFRGEALQLSPYTALIGPNNCGKSTVLRALNMFFADSAKSGSFEPADFSVGAQSDDLSLLFEFDEVTGDASKDLDHYVRDEKVVFELIGVRGEHGQVTTKCRGVRYGLEELAPFFAGGRAAERRPIYEKLLKDGAKLDPWKNMEQAEEQIRLFEKEHPEKFVRISSEVNAYGAAGPIHLLRRHLDWIYVPAVKDVSGEATEARNSAFSKLVIYAIRSKCDFSEQFEKIRSEAQDALGAVIAETQSVLDEVGGEIDKEFSTLTTTPINVALTWDTLKTIAVQEPAIISLFKDGQVHGAPDNFGHGVQRTYIMALLSVASRIQSDYEGMRLLLGVEEPELYQHPPQAQFLSSSMSALADKNAQVLITTHSPYFVTGRDFESVRVLKKEGNVSKVNAWTIDQQRDYCAARKGVQAIGAMAALSGIDRALDPSIGEMFFASKLVFVEGAEDRALLTQYMKQKNVYGDFLKAGAHIIPTGGKGKMPMLLALSRGFYIDAFCLFDHDMDDKKEDRNNDEIIKYAKDVDIEIPNEIDDDFYSEMFVSFRNNIQTSIRDNFSEWDDVRQSVAADWGWTLSRMKKDPMLLEESVRRLGESYEKLVPIKLAVERIMTFLNR